MKIVGIGYKKGVGKNTFAKFLSTYLRCEHSKLRIKEVSFAAKLKDIAHQLYAWAGIRHAQHYENHREDKEKSLPDLRLTPRDIWIKLGNKLREVYDMTWVDYVLHGIANADILIITDVRFQNEARAIHERGGQLIKITRPGVPQGTDPAEIDLDGWCDWDYYVVNRGTLAGLNTVAETYAKEELLNE